MVLVEFLNSGCYNQMHLIDTKLKAVKCGILEGIYWSILVCFFITVAAFRMIIGSKKLEIEPTVVKKYAVIIMCLVFVLLVSFFGIGYSNKWDSYQELIKKYRNQGLTDYQIFYLLETEQGRNSAMYGATIASSTGLLFLGKKEETKKEN